MFKKMVFSALLKALFVAAALFVGQAFANTWLDLDEDEGYTARHEASFVQAGDRFYLFGGREDPQILDTYDFVNNVWTTSASTPVPFNHFQATEYEGHIWVIGAFENNSFPNEKPAEYIYSYDPANNIWLQGREIPQERQRGSTGLVEYNGKFYIVGGNTVGHNGGYEAWFDEFDPETGVWTELQDAPSARDHFHATIADQKLYVAGGRLSGGVGGTFAPLIATVDVYDFATSSWSTLPESGNLPTPRAGTSTVTFQGNVVVIGGEGNGQAYDTVEQLDPNTNLWTEISSLNYARHGTQAIVSGEGIFTAVGSYRQGGGNQHNMESFNSSLAVGDANTRALLEFSLEEVIITSSESVAVELHHTSGNQGALITSVEIVGDDAASFILTDQTTLPNLITVDGSKVISLRSNTEIDGEVASLVVNYDNGASDNILVRTQFENNTPVINLIQNGSFETVTIPRNYIVTSSFDSWKKNGDGRAEFWQSEFKGQPAQDGTVLAELDVGRETVDSLSQDVITVVGQSYDLSVYLKARPSTSSAVNELIVLWNGEEVGRYIGGDSWVNHLVQVVGTGYDRVTLSESANSNNSLGTHIDNIALIASDEPEPAQISNLSLGKEVSQLTTAYRGAATRAVDGNTNGAWRNRSVTHTSNTSQPWWQVDLGALSMIDSVIVYNRTDSCCTSRLSNFYIFISSEPFAEKSLLELLDDPTVEYSYHTSLESSSLEVDFDVDRGARFVRIQLEGSGALSLAEVEVMGIQ